MAANLSIVEPVKSADIDLSVELTKLRALADTVIGNAECGYDKDTIDSVAKLIASVTKLAEFKLKVDNMVPVTEVMSLVTSLGACVNSHIHDRALKAKIQRDWLSLISEAVP